MNDATDFNRYVLVPRAAHDGGVQEVRRFSLGRLRPRPARLGGESLAADRLERLERVADQGRPELM